MTETDVTTSPETATAAVSTTRADERRRSGLNGMVLAELRGIASELGIKGISGLRKGDLIAAINEHGGAPKGAPKAAKTTAAKAEAPANDAPKTTAPAAEPAEAPAAEAPADAATTQTRESRSARAPKGDKAEQPADRADAPAEAPKNDGEQGQQREGGQRRERNQRRGNQNGNQGQDGENRQQGEGRQDRQGDRQQGEGRQDRQQGGRQQGERQQGENRQRGNNGPSNDQNQNNGPDEGDGQGRRGRRFRERRRGRDRNQNDGEPQVSEDDVLQPVAGILDVLDNYAFVRTSGYIAGPNDVYVSMNMIRRNGLRRGDAITGAVKMPRDGENNEGGNQGGGGGRGNQSNRQKFNPLVRLDSVNGQDVESAKNRPEFNKLTPLYPNQRLRLETAQNILTTRVIDLIMPIGKGQRALISAPPKAGKTTVLQDIANAIATNNPECYLMVVLVDERPEEVTDMQRSVRGEVISSTFDRPPSDHTSVAELAIERAKRLVEGGKDVVVLLDSITRLGRAYNNSSPASGRILSGGIDSTALYPPKRFLGAARNIENGGSLTIIATALVETGSTGDTVIFEEFKGTGNAELKLDRKISERRVFPAVDVAASNTRKDELIMAPDEAAVVNKLRRLLAALDSQQAIDLLISQLKKTQNNIEFLMTVQKNSGFGDND
ncbi:MULTISPECIES: transcription termination factor Rho [Tsukamurella]|uniref:Transcription termination factor Rho n=2 Tax=Tsukamurella TaxID=2060 RepID=A0A5C5S1P3_9ACTN|nr:MULTISPECIES: transcription termination factor Rho [Tsukamurella]NMD56412.1 transcription termination factor Rho [Tsukamurella columbiensis]TWS29239.1 transcription termination factor Rho [Tsukamurella conjunctivitidis]